MDMIAIFSAAFITLFVIVDPLGSSSVYAALTAKMPEKDAQKIAVRACVIASTVLVLFGVFGFWILKSLHISLAAFRTTGGLLLFVTAFRMVMGSHDPDQVNSENGVYKDKSAIAVFPLAIPLLAGPGCMTAVLLLVTDASVTSFMHKLIIFAAIVSVEIIAFIAMMGAQRIVRYMGETGSSILSRIMGILLAAMAIQFAADGILELIRT